ncbi:response regulator transcription factor [Staphylococcus chromogenes]|nr:response regulator transcription factor [Staphylococcus chromogenes]
MVRKILGVQNDKKILIVDDDPVIRQVFPTYFLDCPNLEVVATASNGREALRWLMNNQCDIVLTDIHMADLNGLELLFNVKRMNLDLKLVAMTAYDTDETMFTVLKNGGAGYLIKSAPPQEVIKAVQDAIQGGTSLSAQCVTRLVQGMYSKSSVDRSVDREILTAEDKMLTSLIVQGKTNYQIAKELNFAESTIKNKVSRLYKKLKVPSRTMLVAAYRDELWIE